MTRRLIALRVGNFKAFADTQRIPLKPITLIFGPNSAGKSSFIHSLALAHEAQFGCDKRSLARLAVFRQVLKAIIESVTTSEEMRPEDLEGANEAIADRLPELQPRRYCYRGQAT